MLIDAHMHTSGISLCSQASPEEVVAACKKDELDGFVITNHCKESYIKGTTYREWMERYVAELRLTRSLAEAEGMKVFSGIEISPNGAWPVEYLVYCPSDEFLLASPELFAFSQEELYRYCHENGALLYQAHPYRNGATPQDPRFLDGVEINCHPKYDTNEKERVSLFAEQHKLRLSCGSDYHGDTYKSHCGIVVPDSVTDSQDFVNHLRETSDFELVIHDITPGVIW